MIHSGKRRFGVCVGVFQTTEGVKPEFIEECGNPGGQSMLRAGTRRFRREKNAAESSPPRTVTVCYLDLRTREVKIGLTVVQ